MRHGGQVIRGEMKAALLDGDTENYDLDRGFARHPIDDNYGQGLVVKLEMPCIINGMRLLLWDRDMRWVGWEKRDGQLKFAHISLWSDSAQGLKHVMLMF